MTPAETPEPAAAAPALAPSAVADTQEAEWKRQALHNKTILGQADGTLTIGRSGTCSLQIGRKATTISRLHARLTHEHETYTLHILGTNGVRINGALHMAGSHVALRSGDGLNFVGIRFRFREPTVTTAAVVEPEEEWWPEPVRKRLGAEDEWLDAGKRARVAFGDSTDTVVGGGSEIGNTEAVFARHIIEGLPPSSPPPMPVFDESDCESLVGEPLPDVADVVAEAAKPTKQQLSPAAAAAAAGSKDTAGSARPRPRANKPANRPASKRADDDMMASLRELLGIVDPSESLANSIDSETENFLTSPPTNPLPLPMGVSLVDLLVQTMVFSARTSHTISDLLRDIGHADSSDSDAASLWRHHITRTLFTVKCFGRVERRVKDASDRRVEDKWYYEAARDECEERRANFGGLVRTARRCTLRDTQYFFKQVPKLPSFRYK